MVDVLEKQYSLTAPFAATDKHCIFRCCASCFSLPATSVREVAMMPDLVRVPGDDAVLAGLCHVRNEFIPVLRINTLLGESGANRADGRQLIVISGPAGTWALSIEEVVALESLETLINPNVRLNDGRHTAVMGTATFRNQVVRVLDANSLYRRAEELLGSSWRILGSG